MAVEEPRGDSLRILSGGLSVVRDEQKAHSKLEDMKFNGVLFDHL